MEWKKEQNQQLTECVAEANGELEEVRSQLAQVEDDRDEWKKSAMDTTTFTAEVEMLQQQLEQRKLQLTQVEDERDELKKSGMDTTSTAEVEMLQQQLQQQKVRGLLLIGGVRQF